MTRVDLTKAQCAKLANYLRGILNNGMGAGSFDKIEMLVLARRARYAEEIAVLRQTNEDLRDTVLRRAKPVAVKG